MRRLALMLVLTAPAAAQISGGPTAVVSGANDPVTGHTLLTRTDGATQDLGVANRPGNVAFANVTPTGAMIVIPAGQQITRLLGPATIATQTVQLPASPQNGDQVAISTGPSLTISSLSAMNSSGAAISGATNVKLLPLTQLLLLYDSGVTAWVPRLMPATLYNDAQAVAAARAAGFVLSVNGIAADSNGNVAVPAAASYTDAQARAAADIYSGTAPISISGTTVSLGIGAGLSTAGGLLAASLQSVAGLTGAPTATQVQTAIGLGTAAFQPASTFYLASNPAGYLAANQSIALSGDVTGSGSTSIATTLASVNASGAGLFSNITVDAKGRITAIRALNGTDVATALGFTPYNATNPSSYQTAAQVTATVAALPASKLFSGTATTAANGTFTATITPACSAAPTLIEVTAKAAGTGLAQQVNGSWTSSTTTSVSGLITAPATLAVPGLTVLAPPTGTAVSVMGICS